MGLWVPDKDVSECHYCKLTFTLFRRKHHCRKCGNVYCNKCCQVRDNGQREFDMCWEIDSQTQPPKRAGTAMGLLLSDNTSSEGTITKPAFVSGKSVAITIRTQQIKKSGNLKPSTVVRSPLNSS